MKEIVFASGNESKIREVKKILKDLDIQILSLKDLPDKIEIVENGNSFEENAKIKAKMVFKKFKIPVIADDSGLIVEQLNGEPGIYSARYAGDNADDKANNNKLLEELKKYPEPHKAKFVCAAVYYDGERTISATGDFQGRIIDEERGNNGFGYDPLFVPDGYTVTSAQLEPEEKNRISHRYKAFTQLKNILNK
ncbi:MAG: RdgB/HAM1 family non-canonical purine NTP pyrophosphatase [Ignavibacteria bacterium]|jgi:XTP/dITP diphosphohydrolase